MLAATSVLQQQVSEIRTQRPAWQTYKQWVYHNTRFVIEDAYYVLIRCTCSSSVIQEDEYNFIVQYDSADAAGRAAIINELRSQCTKTFLSLLEHVSKDQTIQYVLVLVDDMLQVRKCFLELLEL